jgi:hypothetical protein
MLVRLKAALPASVRVTICAALEDPTLWLPKVRTVALRPTVAEVPVPMRLTAWGLPAALSAMLTEAARLPEAEGVNVTVIVQVPLAATEPGERGHVVVSPKSPALVPVTEMLVMVILPLPVFVRVMV